MKKLFTLFLLLISFNLFAQEQVLFDATAKADLDGYDYVSNFEIVSESGYFTKDELKILQPNEKGIRFIATGVPKSVSTHYTILTSYPSFLNESGTGAGAIYNAGAIKQIKITATTNRPYDEIILLYSTSPNGVIHEIKMPQNFNAIRSMEEFTLVYDNPLYQEDVSKRDVSAAPVLGADADGIYLRGFRIKTNAPSGYSSYSEYSVFYLKSVAIVCDKAFTDEQLEAMKALKEEFGIDENKAIREKTKSDIAERNRVRDNEKALMATEEQTSSAK
ncbi:MAG: hypothetical protein II304_05930 [Bacteroidales bacterium]|nr:hypothetical protein [Bacteroidales bacterium]